MRHNISTFNTNDRALNYGDGCFTTIALLYGKLQFLELHLSRLQKDCERLFIPFRDTQNLREQLKTIENGNPSQTLVIKVLISRGEGGRGYSAQGCTESWFTISKHPFPQHYAQWQQNGIELGVANLRLAQQPALAGVKHLNRLEQVLIKQELNALNCDDVIVMDADDNVIEVSAANLFWYKENQGWCTPSVEKCGIEGVMRNAIVAYFNEQSINIHIADFPIEHVLSATSCFICNSLMGLVPVRVIKTKEHSADLDLQPVLLLAKNFIQRYIRSE